MKYCDYSHIQVTFTFNLTDFEGNMHHSCASSWIHEQKYVKEFPDIFKIRSKAEIQSLHSSLVFNDIEMRDLFSSIYYYSRNRYNSKQREMYFLSGKSTTNPMLIAPYVFNDILLLINVNQDGSYFLKMTMM